MMPEEIINRSAQESIQSFCRKVTIAYDLDEEIQEELYGHIEDKMLGYLNGEEKLTEKDALVLVREHFGKPEHIRSLLEEVHGAQAKGSLARRIGAVVIATMGVELLHPLLGDVIRNIREVMLFSDVLRIAIPLFLILIMLRWQEKADSGKTLWFQRLNYKLFIGLFCGMILLQTFSHFITVNTISLRGKPPVVVPAHSFYYPLHSLAYKVGVTISARSQGLHGYGGISLYTLIMIFQLSLMFLVWLWWCDTPHQRIRSLFYAFGAWVAYCIVLPLAMPIGVYQMNPDTQTTKFVLQSSVILNELKIGSLSRFYIPALLICLVLGAALLGSYLLLTRYRILIPRRVTWHLKEEPA